MAKTDKCASKVRTDDHVMEERFSKVGARIDELIEKAHEMKGIVHGTASDLKLKKDTAVRRTGSALDELKSGLNAAWTELNQAWDDIRDSADRAAGKLLEKEAKDACNDCGSCEQDTSARKTFCTPHPIQLDKPIIEPDDFQGVV
jgi:hypothetical protein